MSMYAYFGELGGVLYVYMHGFLVGEEEEIEACLSVMSCG